MNDILKVLIEIQGLEDELQEITRRKRVLPGEINELESEIERLRKEKEKVIADFKKEEVKLRELEVDLREIQEKIRSFQEKARQVKSNEEFRAMQSQIEHADLEKRKKEEEIIAQLELVENLKNQLPDKTAKIEGELALKMEELNSKKEEFEKLNEAFEQKKALKETLLTKLPNKDRELFEKLYARLGPVVVCKVIMASNSVRKEIDYACSGCNSVIPPAFVQNLKMREDYSRCPNCGRIIYYHEEM
ncbi:MAG: C4-type zinc ribbon domain-containing protein [candidate division WOR-3 bacterium]